MAFLKTHFKMNVILCIFCCSERRISGTQDVLRTSTKDTMELVNSIIKRQKASGKNEGIRVEERDESERQ